MFEMFRTAWLNLGTLELMGYAFFISQKDAREFVEDSYLALIAYNTKLDHPFGAFAHPRHDVGGFVLESVLIPEDSLIAVETEDHHHDGKMIKPETHFFITPNHEPQIWREARSFKVKDEYFVVCYDPMTRIAQQDKPSNVVKIGSAPCLSAPGRPALVASAQGMPTKKSGPSS